MRESGREAVAELKVVGELVETKVRGEVEKTAFETLMEERKRVREELKMGGGSFT